ncbi:MAG: hypothetical protein IPO37_24035 [Saprospiraceae bacterium]|nr:hypothetical protein [Saprospiraceae bacterium]
MSNQFLYFVNDAKVAVNRYVCVASTGYNNIDKVETNNMQIQVSNVKGYSIPSIAQHVFSALLCKHPTNPVLPTFGIGGTFAKKNKVRCDTTKNK